jgi:hypothetical protein
MGDQWMVEWSIEGSGRYTSYIAKSDLTVIDSGICLSGEDCLFDLQSLVGVMRSAPW